MKQFSDLVGKVLVEAVDDANRLRMVLSDGTVCELYHEQDCCESVTINEINGQFADLVGKPLTVATEEDVSDDPVLSAKSAGDESFTWTKYTLATADHEVSILWYGVSNGYYSEDVYFRVDRKGGQ